MTLWKKPASKAGCGSFTASERNWGSLYRYPEVFKPAGLSEDLKTNGTSILSLSRVVPHPSRPVGERGSSCPPTYIPNECFWPLLS